MNIMLRVLSSFACLTVEQKGSQPSHTIRIFVSHIYIYIYTYMSVYDYVACFLFIYFFLYFLCWFPPPSPLVHMLVYAAHVCVRVCACVCLYVPSCVRKVCRVVDRSAQELPALPPLDCGYSPTHLSVPLACIGPSVGRNTESVYSCVHMLRRLSLCLLMYDVRACRC